MNSTENEICFPQLNNNIYTDVLIIGGGIAGAISAYILNEKNIKTTIIKRDNFFSDINSSVDHNLIDIGKYSSNYDKLSLFRSSLDAIYKLEEIIIKHDFKCDYFRRPKLNYKYKESIITDYFIYPFFSKNLLYSFGAELNLNKFIKELYRYNFYSDIHIYQNTGAFEISFLGDSILVTTKNKQKIICKSIFIVDYSESQLFFDKPTIYKNTFNNKSIVNINLLNNNLNYSNNEFVEPSTVIEKNSKIISIENKGIECLFYDYSSKRDNYFPYICRSDEYPQVYFNLSYNSVLYSLIGAMSLSEEYLGFE